MTDDTHQVDAEDEAQEAPQYTRKKGSRSWKPADLLTIHNMDDRFRYRWEVNDPAVIQKRKAEGWELCSGVTSDKSRRAGRREVQDGDALTSVSEYRELVQMRIPAELAEERNEYFRELSSRATENANRRERAEMERQASRAGTEANIRGTISID